LVLALIDQKLGKQKKYVLEWYLPLGLLEIYGGCI
jgi:hypothetical protein